MATSRPHCNLTTHNQTIKGLCIHPCVHPTQPKLRNLLLTLPSNGPQRQQWAPSAVVGESVAGDERFFRTNGLAVAQRILQVGNAALRFLATLLRASWDQTVLGSGTGKFSAQTLQALLTGLGPTFVKLAQTLSMRPDLIGDDYASALTELQDNVAPFPNDDAFRILRQELGCPVTDVFATLSADPVASASLGQVYRGMLRPEWGGHHVAVKIQRPGAAESIALDFQVLRQLIGVAQRAAGLARDLRPLADEVGAALQGECDFRNEAANAAAFQRAHVGLSFVMVPRVVSELTTRRVLVSEWVDGCSPTQLLASRAADSTGIISMVRMGIQCSLAQLLVTGCMHGDPHSGNMLLARDGRLCYLDFGLIVLVSPRHRQAMMAALVHLGLGEWGRLVADLAELDLLKPGTNEVQLAADLEVEFSAVLRGAAPAGAGPMVGTLPLLSLQSSSLSFSTLAGVLFHVAYKYRFLLPSYFPLVVRAVSSLEGVALSVDPNFKLVSAGMPVVLNQLLSDRRPAAQTLLRELLLAPSGALRTDETTQQILQVWLSAAQQAAKGDALASGSAAKDKPASPIDAALGMTSLLLDRRNVPLRRTLIDANPAATIASMPPAIRDQLVRILTEALSSEGGVAAAAGLMERSSAARAQRKRLAMLVKASVPKVISSPPSSILQLVAFTVSVVVAVINAKVKQAWQALIHWVTKLLAKLHGDGNTPPGATP